MANPNDNTPADKSFLGTGPFGATPDQGLPDFDYPRFPPHVGTQVNNQYGGSSSSESPNIPEEPATAPIMPFQPNVFQDAEDGQWYFDFETSGVVFLPVATGTQATIWHNHWNEAWPFRPTITDHTSTLKAINDVDKFGGYVERKPRLLLAEGEYNIIYLKVTCVADDNIIARRADGSGAFSGVKVEFPPLQAVKADNSNDQLITDGINGTVNTGSTGDVSGGDDNDFRSHLHSITTHTHDINLNIKLKHNEGTPFGTGSQGITDPAAYVPLAERNYHVTTAPEILVVKAADDDDPAALPISVRHDDWRNTDTVRVFPWGSIYIDDSTSTPFARVEWWRFDCPTYNLNSHTIDNGSDPTRAYPADHGVDEDVNVADLNAPNDGLDVTV